MVIKEIMAGVFLFSGGVAALIQEITWLKILNLLCGSSLIASGIVLIAFMLGFGLGCRWYPSRISFLKSYLEYFFGKISPRGNYQLVEGALGIYGLLAVFLQSLANLSYSTLSGENIPSLFRFIGPTLLVFFPAFLMGATLPLAKRVFENKISQLHRLYAFNTLGAAFGALLGGFYLLPYFGVIKTLNIAGFIHLFLAFVLSTFAEPGCFQKEEAPLPQENRLPILVPLFLLGVLGMGFQVGTNHLLTLSLGSSVFSFSIILFSYILGLGLGPLVLGKWIEKNLSKGVLLFGCFFLFLAGSFNYLPYFYQKMSPHFPGEFFPYLGLITLGVFLFLAPVTLLSGALFTSLGEKLIHKDGPGGVSRALFTNTLGGVLGTGLVAFFLVPRLGTVESLFILGLLYFTVLVLASPLPLEKGWALGLLILFSLNPIRSHPFLLTSGPFYRWERFATTKSFDSFLKRQQRQKILHFEEDGLALVSVHEDPSGRVLKVNGKADASDREDMPTQRVIAHLPLLLSPKIPYSALCIGLGSGVTPASIQLYQPKILDVVELSRGVISSLPFFKHVNKEIWKNPNVKIHQDDGRHFVAQSKRTYDLILSEPSNPWMVGVSSLYTKEHLEKVRGILNLDGVYAQWIHTYEMDTSILKDIGKTFCEVFPQASLWQITRNDLVFIGSHKPLNINMGEIQKRWFIPGVAEEMRECSFLTPQSLPVALLAWGPDMEKMFEGGEVATDDLNPVEYKAPKALFYGKKSVIDLQWLYQFHLQDFHPFFKLGLGLNPQNLEGMGVFLHQMGQKAPAQTVFESLFKRGMGRKTGALFLAQSLHFEGNHDKCDELVKSYQNSSEPSGDSLTDRVAAEISMDHKAFAHGAKFLERLLENSPPDTLEIQAKLAECYLKTGESETAFLFCQEVLKKFPLDPYSNYLNGLIQKNRGFLKESSRAFESVLWHEELKSDSFFQMGLLKELEKDPKTAQVFFEKALQVEPTNSKVLDHLKRFQM